MRPTSILVLTLLAACSSGEISVGDPDKDDTDVVDTDLDDTDAEDTDAGDTDVPPDTDLPEPDYSAFDGATLEIVQPVSAGIYRIVNGVPAEAEIRAADGSLLDFDDVVWTIREAPSFGFTGLVGNPMVPAGVYTFDATASLPNGDRLRGTVGSVRVQSRLTGVFAGDLGIAAYTEVQGQTIRTDCIGSIDFTVDLAGQILAGSGGCSLAIPLLGTIPLTFDLEGSITDPEIAGNVLIDIPFLQIPVPFIGGFPTSDRMVGQFEADLTVFRIEGSIEARKVTEYVTP